MAWTKDQERAIYESGTNIIVSAGAGSGKTAVLTERTIQKILKGTSIDRLLILTFTNAAAAEMKDRIRKAIKKQGLKSELEKIDSSYITTFDSFALSLVKKYHLLLSLSKNVDIMDSALEKMLENKFVDQIFEDNYKNENFQTLIGDFCIKSDKKMKEIFLELSHKIDLNIEKEQYLQNYISVNYSDKVINSYIESYFRIINNTLNEIKQLYQELSFLVDKKYLDTFNLITLLEAKTYEDIKLGLVNVGSPRKNKNCDEACTLVKDQIKLNLNKLDKLTRFENVAEIKHSLVDTKKYAIVFINLKKEFDEIFWNYKMQNNIFTFNDISKLALKLLNDYPNVCLEIKNSFDEIMVDEYQDTSDIQEKFLNLISENNLYMVGDIKQSIYRFRNANPYIFQNKYNNYARCDGGIKIDLLKNFRSRSEVLDNINLIFKYIMDDNIGDANYKDDHQMNFGNSLYTDNVMLNADYNMDILNYNPLDNPDFSCDEIESFIVASDIKQKVENGYQILDKESGQLRNAKYSDFAIIMDRGSSFDLYRKIFEYLSVPLTPIKNEKLSLTGDLDIFKNLINLIIKINKKEFDNNFRYYFTSVARSFLINMLDEDIFDVFTSNSFFSTELFNTCEKINIYQHNSVSLFDEIIDKFNVYEKILNISNINERLIILSYIKKLANILSNVNFTIEDFADFLSSETLKDSIEYSLNTDNSDSVKILNIHKSKGLEYSICYFTGLNKMTNKDELKSLFLVDSNFNIILPYINDGIKQTITKDILIEEENKKIISEKIRLFYVALTRCKEKMILVCPLNLEKEGYLDMVPDNVRLSFNKITDMLEAILPIINPYIKNVNLDNLNLNKDYNKKMAFDINKISKSDESIIISENTINYDLIQNLKFSKNKKSLISKTEKENMLFGQKVHQIFEYEDFKNPTSAYVLKFTKHIDLNYLNIYKEYEFIIQKDNIVKNGIIDLLLEYEDYFMIIDYKTKEINDEDYNKQLMGYKEYIESITNKKCKLYLYSILNDTMQEIKNTI